MLATVKNEDILRAEKKQWKKYIKETKKSYARKDDAIYSVQARQELQE